MFSQMIRETGSAPSTAVPIKPIKLVPFGLQWPIFGYLHTVAQRSQEDEAELRLLLIMSEFEEREPKLAEARYTLLRSLHDQLQSTAIPFSIETAIGTLEKTAVAYAIQCQADEIYLSELSPKVDFGSTPPCKTTLLHSN